MLLARFGRRIASETRIDSLLTIIAEEVRHILYADRCSVFLIEAEKHELWTKVALGVGEKVLRIPIGQGIAGFVAKTGSAVNIRDAYRDTRFTQDFDRITGYQTKTVLAVPLKDREGRALGVFEVLNKSKGAFNEEDEGFLRILATIAASAIENAKLYDNLRKSHLETIYRMAMVAEYRDQQDTASHLRRISKYTGLVAAELGLPLDLVEDLRYASPLHDIGKVAIPDSILLKPGKLTPDEYEEMKKHPVYGGRMLENAESRLLKLARNIALSHHEHWDGTGYPYGLKGEEIPIEARIVSVVDVYDALTTRRVYKGAWSVDDTMRYMNEQSGRLFDPKIIDAFVKCRPMVEDLMKEESHAAGESAYHA
ncbi:MAG: response regulator containing a CheY-like receiver domain [Elusimicrobia bacterium]|nr:MAG: response regulator containing a CheY-like receiver domain [Elusimicrobiota bacterium]